jgi:Copper type II ascorbate-dependent monooxygenase, C-terminal domain
MQKTILFSILAITLFFAACEKNLNDYDPKAAPAFPAYPAPKAGEGYQVHIPLFPIAANSERESYIHLPVGNKEEVYLTGIETIQRPGTHHLVLYDFDATSIAKGLPPVGMMFDQNMANGKGNLQVQNGLDMSIFFVSTSNDVKYKLPDGYAFKMRANASFNFNPHYFNKTNEMRFGESYVNFNTIPKSKVKQVINNMTLEGNQNLILKPKERVTLKNDTIFDRKTTVVSMISHCHKRGEKFVIKYKGGKRDGEILYVSEDYANAPYLNFPKPLVIEKGEGFSWEVTYNNETNRTITYGVTSEDEMNFIFGFYYQE